MKNITYKNIIGSSFVKFCIIGLVSAGIQFGIYVVLLYINTNYIIASSIGFILATLFAYLGNRLWTFQSTHSWKKQFMIFSITRILMLLVNSLILYFCVDALEISKIKSQFIAMFIVTFVNYYLGKKIFKK